MDDVWSTEQIEMFHNYSVGNQDVVRDMISKNPDLAFAMIENLMKDKLSNSLIRERVICKQDMVDHSCTMHNFDGYDPVRLRYVEVKNEQHVVGGRKYQVTGGAAFGGIENYEAVDRLVLENPIIKLGGWLDGKLAYIVEFDFNDTTIADRLRTAVTSRKAGATTAPKFLWSDWKMAPSLKVTFLELKTFLELYHYISTDLALLIYSKWNN